MARRGEVGRCHEKMVDKAGRGMAGGIVGWWDSGMVCGGLWCG